MKEDQIVHTNVRCNICFSEPAIVRDKSVIGLNDSTSFLRATGTSWLTVRCTVKSNSDNGKAKKRLRVHRFVVALSLLTNARDAITTAHEHRKGLAKEITAL